MSIHKTINNKTRLFVKHGHIIKAYKSIFRIGSNDGGKEDGSDNVYVM